MRLSNQDKGSITQAVAATLVAIAVVMLMDGLDSPLGILLVVGLLLLAVMVGKSMG